MKPVDCRLWSWLPGPLHSRDQNVTQNREPEGSPMKNGALRVRACGEGPVRFWTSDFVGVLQKIPDEIMG